MTKIITRKSSLDDFCSGIAQSYGVNKPKIHLSNSGRIYEVHKGKSDFGVKLGAGIALVELISQLTSPVIAEAANLTINAYKQDGSVMDSTSVIVNDPVNGERTYNTGAGNNVVIPDCVTSDSTSVTMKRAGKIGATQKILLPGDYTFNGALLDTLGARKDSLGTPLDVNRIRADELKSVFGVNGTTRHNPRLFDVQSSWPNLNIPTAISSAFSDADSAAVRSWLEWRNNYSGKTIFNFVASIDTLNGPGIYMKPGTSNATQGSYTGNYLDLSICKLTTPVIDTKILHEASFHGLIYASGHGTIYSPTNYDGFASVITQPKDAIYMDLGYLLQYLRQTGKNNFNMSAYQDSLTVNGVAGSPISTIPNPFNAIRVRNYPNPVRDHVALIYKLPEKAQSKAKIKIYNIAGQLVKQEEMTSQPGENKQIISTNGLKNGVYPYTISSVGFSSSGLIIITR